MIRALFLDAAGTLIEPAEPVADVYARAAAARGLAIPAAAIRSSFRRVFSGLPDPDWTAHPAGDDAERAWWLQVVTRTLTLAAEHPIPPAAAAGCFTDLFAHYEEASAWSVFPEVADVLDAARSHGWKCAVVSNFDRRLHAILAGHSLSFDAVVTSADARARKPERAIFGHTLDLLGVAPEEVAHAGDSPRADIDGAAAVAIRGFLVTRPQTDLRGFLAFAESL